MSSVSSRPSKVCSLPNLPDEPLKPFHLPDAQPQIKDKSAWRKSTLNVPNSTEETRLEAARQRFASGGSKTINEDSRKDLISQLGEKPASDRLTLYMRKPSDGALSNGRISNKVEIDSDNIETPPATRKIFPTAVDKREPTPPTQCKRMLARPVRELPPSPEDVEPSTILGDGQFDRFSSARRTRRYKRNPDAASGATVVEINTPEAPAETQVRKWSQFQL